MNEALLWLIITNVQTSPIFETKIVHLGVFSGTNKGGFKSEETGEFLNLQNKYSISLSWAENLNLPPKTVNNLFKCSAQDSDLEYLFWRSKNSPVSSDLKPPLIVVQ